MQQTKTPLSQFKIFGIDLPKILIYLGWIGVFVFGFYKPLNKYLVFCTAFFVASYLIRKQWLNAILQAVMWSSLLYIAVTWGKVASGITALVFLFICIVLYVIFNWKKIKEKIKQKKEAKICQLGQT